MPAPILLLELLLLGSPALSSCSPFESGALEASDPAASGLACEMAEVAYGEVWDGAVLQHEFELRCLSEPVRVEAIRADCGCTVAELEIEGRRKERLTYDDGREIPPGSVLYLGARYDTRGKRGHSPRTLSVHTDRGVLELVMDATVKPWVVVEPDQIDVPESSNDEVVVKSFTIKSADGGVFRLKPTGRGTPPEVSVEVVPSAPFSSGEREGVDARGYASNWEAIVTLGPNLPLGMRGYPIEMEVEPHPSLEWGALREGEGSLRVTPMVLMRVVGDVSLRPTSLSFGSLSVGETVARTLRLRGHDPEFRLPEPRVRIEMLRPRSDELAALATLSSSAVAGENAWDIQILVDGFEGRFEGQFLGRLVVATGHPDQPEVEATFHGFLPLGPPASAGAQGQGSRRVGGG